MNVFFKTNKVVIMILFFMVCMVSNKIQAHPIVTNCSYCDNYLFERTYARHIHEVVSICMYLEDVPYGQASVWAVDGKLVEALTNLFFQKTVRKNHLIVAAAYALHVGVDEFVNSPFYKAYRENQSVEKCFVQIDTSKEEKKALWIIEALWREDLRVIDIESFPTMSYTKLKTRKIYKHGNYRYDPKFWEILAEF